MGPPVVHVTDWGVLLRLHRRPQYIKKIFDCIRSISRGRKAWVVVCVDRPTPAVVIALSRQMRQLPDRIRVRIWEPPEPLVAERERFMAVAREHYAELRDWAPAKAATLWDDDMWLDRAGIRELRRHMDALAHDRVDVCARFLWDKPERWNGAMLDHWQTVLFRVLPDDNFPLDYNVHAPHAVSQSGSVARMKEPLWNAGYLTREDREHVFTTYKRVGKLDPHVLSLLRPARLMKI